MNIKDALAQRYEELRQRALDQHQGGAMWGLVVLRTKGMVSWARSWQEHGEGGVAAHMPSKGSAFEASPFSLTSEEVVRVLAGMVWAFQKEAGS